MAPSKLHLYDSTDGWGFSWCHFYSCASFILIDDEFPGWPTHVGSLTFLDVYQFFKTNLSKKSDKNVTFNVRNQPIMKEFLHGSIETILFYERIHFSLILIFPDLIIGFVFLLKTISLPQPLLIPPNINAKASDKTLKSFDNFKRMLEPIQNTRRKGWRVAFWPTQLHLHLPVRADIVIHSFDEDII